jgi:hypothetical protein
MVVALRWKRRNMHGAPGYLEIEPSPRSSTIADFIFILFSAGPVLYLTSILRLAIDAQHLAGEDGE